MWWARIALDSIQKYSRPWPVFHFLPCFPILPFRTLVIVFVFSWILCTWQLLLCTAATLCCLLTASVFVCWKIKFLFFSPNFPSFISRCFYVYCTETETERVFSINCHNQNDGNILGNRHSVYQTECNFLFKILTRVVHVFFKCLHTLKLKHTNDEKIDR